MVFIDMASCRLKNEYEDQSNNSDIDFETRPTYVGKLDCTWTGCQINGVELSNDWRKIEKISDFCIAVEKTKHPKSGFYRLNNRYVFCDFANSRQDDKYVGILVYFPRHYK